MATFNLHLTSFPHISWLAEGDLSWSSESSWTCIYFPFAGFSPDSSLVGISREEVQEGRLSPGHSWGTRYTQCCVKVGPASQTLGQHQPSIGSTCRVCLGDWSDVTTASIQRLHTLLNGQWVTEILRLTVIGRDERPDQSHVLDIGLGNSLRKYRAWLPSPFPFFSFISSLKLGQQF